MRVLKTLERLQSQVHSSNDLKNPMRIKELAQATGVDVETIAAEMGKTARSIIAKLSREGVYKSKQKQAGEKRLTKTEMLNQIEQLVGLDQGHLMSLEKGAHNDLSFLLKQLIRMRTRMDELEFHQVD